MSLSQSSPERSADDIDTTSSSSSFWLKHRPLTSTPPAPTSSEYDVCIIGAGLTGISTAHWLKQYSPNLSIVIIDSRGLGEAASGRNGGHVYPSFGPSEQTKGKYGLKNAQAMHEFEMDTMKRIKEFLEVNDKVSPYVEHGGVMLLRWEEEIEALKADLALRKDADDLEVFNSAEEVSQFFERCGRVPSPPHDYKFGVFNKKIAALNPLTLHSAVLQSVENDITFERCTATKVIRLIDAPRKFAVETQKTTLRCNSVVLAANALLAKIDLGDMLPMAIEVVPTRGQCVHCSVHLPFNVCLDDGEIYAAPVFDNEGRCSGSVVGGARYVDAPNQGVGEVDDSNPQSAVDSALRDRCEHLAALFGGEEEEEVTYSAPWSGIMGFTPDYNPLLGRVVPGVFVAAGFSGEGMPKVFGAARLVAAMVAAQGEEENKTAETAPLASEDYIPSVLQRIDVRGATGPPLRPNDPAPPVLLPSPSPNTNIMTDNLSVGTPTDPAASFSQASSASISTHIPEAHVLPPPEPPPILHQRSRKNTLVGQLEHNIQTGGNVVTRIRVFLEHAYAPSDSLEMRRAKLSTVSALFAVAVCSVLLSAVLFGLRYGASSHYPRMGSYLVCSFMSCGLLGYMLLTQKGLVPIRFVVAFMIDAASLPHWLLYSQSSGLLGPALMVTANTHMLSLVVFALMGGDLRSFTGGRLLSLVHLVFVWVSGIVDYANIGCSVFSAGQVDEMDCILLYFEVPVLHTLSAVGGHLSLQILLRWLDHEQMVGDALVDNCLPRSISSDIRAQISSALQEASRERSHELVKQYLKEQPELIGFHVAPTVGAHDNVSVLFADVCGFTHASSSMEPTELVDVLRGVFQEVDRLCICLQLEKIKTIGDCYMVCGNLQLGSAGRHRSKSSRKTDAENGALAVIELGNTIVGIRGYFLGQVEVRFRVGIHTGPLVSGVIGLTKFSLDVWGDTVNIASRMETTGMRDRVQCSQSTRDLVAQHHTFAQRNVVVKGINKPITTYILQEQLSPSSRKSSDMTIESQILSKASDSGMTREASVEGDVLSRTSSMRSNPSPLVVGPSFFQKVDGGKRDTRISLSRLVHNPLHKGVVAANVRKTLAGGGITDDGEESLTDDLLLMMTPRSRPRLDAMAASEVTQWLYSLGLSSLIEQFYGMNWRSLDGLMMLSEKDFIAAGLSQEICTMLVRELEQLATYGSLEASVLVVE